MKFEEPSDWELFQGDSFYQGFKSRGELYSMTLPDWEIAEKYLDQKRGCLDIGGHIGTTALRYANNFEQVYSFEPLYHKIMNRNLSHVTNIEVYPYAVSDADEEMTMIMRAGNTGLSLILTDETRHYKTRAGYNPKEIKMETRVVDDYQFTEIDFIKIDTEGFVLRPLKGMLHTLEENDWPLLQIEFNNLNPNTEECFALLKDLNYKQVDQFHVDHFFQRV
jgi:FkbM family methyltransferase